MHVVVGGCQYHSAVPKGRRNGNKTDHSALYGSVAFVDGVRPSFLPEIWPSPESRRSKTVCVARTKLGMDVW